MPAATATRHAINLATPEFREMRRTFAVDRAAIDVENRTVDLSFASEAPVDRWFGREILDVTPESCDLTRLNNGGAVLVNHNWDDQIGVVTEARIDATTKKARAKVKFSQSERGQEIFQDIQDGIRSLVSVGYIVRQMVLQSVQGDVETHRVTDWQPYEVSLVAVPADSSVGVGRSVTPAEKTTAERTTAPAASQRQPSLSMPTETQSPSVSVTPGQDFASERQRVKDIAGAARVMAEKYPAHADAIRKLGEKCLETGDGVEVFNRALLNDVLATQQSATPTRQVSADLGLSKKEQAQYSLFRAMRLKAENRPLDGIELEASRAEAKRLGRDAEGFFVPAEVFSFGRNHLANLHADRVAMLEAMFNRSVRDLSAASPADGGYTVGHTIDTANMVPLLRNASHILTLGARVLTGLTGDVTIPRVLTGSTVYWVSETGQITSTTPTFGQLVMKPRRIGAVGVLGKQLIIQSSMDVEAFYRETVMADMGVELDRVAINGQGGAEPLGIMNLPAGARATDVTFGGAATWAKVVSFETLVETANALGLAGGPYAYLTTPAARGKWKTTAKATGAAIFLWEGNEVNGYQARSTNQVPSDKAIFGQFSQILFGEWAGIDLTIDAVTYADKAQIKVTMQKFVDMIVRQGKAFSVSTDTAAA